MVNALHIDKKVVLQKFGFSPVMTRDYGLMLDGFDDHLLKLLCHTGNPSQMESINMRIGNPVQIDNAEADYLVRKMMAGYYPWTVDECLDHVFEGRAGNKVNGCKWCRERAEAIQNSIGLSGDVVEATPEQVQESVSPEFPDSQTETTPPSVTLEEVICTECGWMSAAKSKRGIPRSNEQRKHALKMHKRAVHLTGVPADAGTAEGITN